MITLKKGEIGPLVEMLQLALQRAGYNTDITGNFGEELENTVKDFQSANNLTVDGIAGPDTWAKAEPYLRGYKKDNNGNTTQFDFDIVPTNIRYVWELLKYVTDGLGARYPFIETGNIGKSVMGNDIFYIKIGTGQTEVMYNATHHANEWITTPLLLKFAEQYAKAYADKGEIYGKSAEDLYDSDSYEKHCGYHDICEVKHYGVAG